ncbi:hypothetical protein [Mycolicibacterium sp. XJ1819]
MSSAASEPTVNEHDEPDDGRPVVLEPTPPGLWPMLLGLAVAVLAPLFGFLVGGIFGAGTTGDSIDPMFLSLFAGIVIGGIGLLVAIAGGTRLWRRLHLQDASPN